MLKLRKCSLEVRNLLVRSRPFIAGVEFILGSKVYTLAHRSHTLIKKESLEDLKSDSIIRFKPVQILSALYLKSVSTTVSLTEYTETYGAREASSLTSKQYIALRGNLVSSTKLQGYSKLELPTPDGTIIQEIWVVGL